MVPVVSLLFLVKTIAPIVNVQHVFYGLNISLGFLFTFLFFRLLDKTKKDTHVLAALLAACLYVTSPYIVKTLYQFELVAFYLVMLVPLFSIRLPRVGRKEHEVHNRKRVSSCNG